MLDQQEKYDVPLHLILIFVLLVIGIVTSGYLLYAIQKAEFKKRENNNLSVIADMKVREIVNWRKEKLWDAHVVQQNLPAIHRIRQFLENPSSIEIKQELLSWIKSLRENNEYGSVVLLDTNKQVRLYWGDETRLVGSNVVSLADDAMRTKQIVFSDIRWGQVKHVIRMDIFVPLIIQEGHENIPVGVLLLRIDPHQTLYPIIQFWPTSSPTAETLVVRREGDEVVFLNELRHKKDTALTFRMPISEKQFPAAMAARGEEGIVEGMDYRSVPVLAAIRAVPDTPWYVIAKIDSDEVYVPVHERFWMMFIVACALIIAVGTGIALVWRHQRARFYRKQYETELEHKALTKHYEYLTKYANDIVLMMDADWKIVEANDRAVQAYGCTRDELLQMNIRDIRDPGALPKLDGLLEQLDERNGMVYETIHHRKDGTTFPAEISARTITVEGKKFYQGIIRDITERKRAEEALRKSEEYFRAITENASDIILVADIKGTITYASPSVDPVLGLKPEELIGKSSLNIIVSDDLQRAIHDFEKAILTEGTLVPNAFRVRHKDGSERVLEGVGKNLFKNPAVSGFVMNVRDVTERRQAEEEIRKYSAELTEKNEELRAMTQQLWQTSKLATMGELSASIAHELNNPLATVSLRVESLLKKTPQDNSNHREMEIIEQEVKRMTTLIANLLQFSRRGQQQISTVDICEEIEKSLELIYYHLRKNNVVIRREFAKEAPRIQADRQQLLQLFLNLFTNASDAMPQGGTLTIRVTTPPESKQVIIEVADTGTGISPEILPKVAEPFYTTKPEGKGTGLGLAICRRIMQEHKGTFDLVSEGISGKGTTARISFPVTNVTNAARKINDRSNR